MNIRDFLKEKVKEAGTQTAVARKTGVSQPTILRILNDDTNPDLKTIQKVATAYGLSISDFVEAEPFPHGTEKFKQFSESRLASAPIQQEEVPVPPEVAHMTEKYLDLDPATRIMLMDLIDDLRGLDKDESRQYVANLLAERPGRKADKKGKE